MIRADFRAGIVLLAVLLIAGGCGGSRKDGAAAGGTNARIRKVVVYTPHGQEMLDEYKKAFEAAYPDIAVVGRFVPTGEILSQLAIDKATPQVDVWWGGTSAFFSQAKEQRLLAPYKPSWAAAVKPEYHDKNDFWYAQFLQVPAIMFNKNIYKMEDIPATWEGLLDPKWKGKVIIREPLDSGTLKTIFSGIVWLMGGAKGNPEPGYEFLKKLDAQTRSYIPNPQALYDRVAKSEAGYITLWNLTDVLFQRGANAYPFEGRVPEGPVPVSLDPIALIANGPNPTEAKLFYEFVTSKENCIKMTQVHYRILARDDIKAEELPSWMAGVRFEPMQADLMEFDRAQVEWMKHWQTSIRDPGK